MTHKTLDRNGKKLHEGDVVKVIWHDCDSVTTFTVIEITDTVLVKPISSGIGYSKTIVSTDLRKLEPEELI